MTESVESGRQRSAALSVWLAVPYPLRCLSRHARRKTKPQNSRKLRMMIGIPCHGSIAYFEPPVRGRVKKTISTDEQPEPNRPGFHRDSSPTEPMDGSSPDSTARRVNAHDVN